MNTPSKIETIGIVFSLAFISAPLAHCAAPTYESFDYSNGATLDGQVGGVGFSGSWSGNSAFVIAAGSLIDPTGAVESTGNRVTSGAAGANKDVHRDLTLSVGTPGTTAYFSWLIRPEGTIGNGFDNGTLGLILSGGPITSTDLFVGRPGSPSVNYPYVLENVGGAQQHTSPVVPVSGQTVLMVLRADFTAITDTFRLYINPPGNGIEPAVASATKSDLNVNLITRFYIAGPGAFSFDELQVGPTYESVTTNAVPEPTSGWLFSAAALVLIRCRARRLT